MQQSPSILQALFMIKNTNESVFITLIIAFFMLSLSACADIYDNQYTKTDSRGEIIELKRHFSYAGTEYKVTANLNGQIELNEDASDIIELPKNSSLNIWLIDEKLAFSFSNSQSGTVRSVSLNDKPIQESEQTHIQLQAALLAIFRNTSLNSKYRVNTIFAKKGLKGVLNEIEQIQNGDTQGVYITELAKLTQLTPNQQQALLKATKLLSSDYVQAKTIASIAKHQKIQANKVWITLFESTKNIGSDYELTELLMELSTVIPNSFEAHDALLNVSKTIDSDYEKRRLLVHLAIKSRIFPIDKILNASQDIGSDYELQRVLTALPYEKLATLQTIKVVELASKEMDSDYELANTLVDIIHRSPNLAQLQPSIKLALTQMSSESDKVRVYEIL